MVTKGIVLHVDPNKVIQAGRGEAENAGDFFSVEEIGSLVPVDPHSTKIIAEQIVQWIPGEEAQTVWDPVSLLGVVVKVRLGLLTQFADCFGALFVSAGPDAQGNSIKGVRRILL